MAQGHAYVQVPSSYCPCRPDDVARFEQQRVGVGIVPLGEEVGQDADDVVAEL